MSKLNLDFGRNTDMTVQLTSDFDKDDKVAILVETDNKAMYQNFWIEKSKYSGGKWSHQLRGRDGKLHNGGAWFAEGDLHDPK